MKSCSAAAPCSTANLGPGYDVFGLALDALEDKVKVSRIYPGVGRITIKNSDQAIPSMVESNSAGLVVKKMMQDFEISDSTEIEITKGVPTGYGVGSSAASAAAAAMAFNALYDLKIDRNRLVEYAAEGEVARSVLPKMVPLKDVVHNISGAATIVAGFALKDVETITRGIDDVIIESARKHLIPGYDSVKQNAISAGALAVTISGAGPSMIAFLKTNKNAKMVAAAMAKGFKETGVESRTFVCRASKGARLLAL